MQSYERIGREPIFLGCTEYTLEKASSSEAKYLAKIDGILSTETEDVHGQVLLIDGCDIGPLNNPKFNPVINWWHLHQSSPKHVVGFVDGALKKSAPRKEITFKGHISKTQVGHDVCELMKVMEDEGRKMGVSIEGLTLKTSKDRKQLLKTVAYGAALATNQANKDAVATLAKAVGALSNFEADLEEMTSDQVEGLYKTISEYGNAPYGQSPLTTTNLGFMAIYDRVRDRMKKRYKGQIDEKLMDAIINKYMYNGVPNDGSEMRFNTYVHKSALPSTKDEWKRYLSNEEVRKSILEDENALNTLSDFIYKNKAFDLLIPEVSISLNP